MRSLCILLVFALSGSPVSAAVDCNDANAVEVHEAGPADPRTIAYTTPAGSNQITLIGWGHRSGGTRSSTTVTMGGNSASAATTYTYTNTIIGGNLHYYVNPPAGTNDIVVDWDPSGGPTQGHVIIFTCSGVDVASPFRSTNQASGFSTAVEVTLATINTGDVAVDFAISNDGSALSVGANQTVIHQGESTSASAGASRQPGANGGVMEWTSALADDWAIFAGALKPASEAVEGGALWFP